MVYPDMKALDKIISRSLRSFLNYINRNSWVGRENEAISLFAFGFLQRECSADGLLRDPTQIGIEVGAADTSKSPKSQVRKDLVLWPEPGANRWHPRTPRSEPLAIMEWKVKRPDARHRPTSRADIDWLGRHCRSHCDTVGYAVLLDLTSHPSQLVAVRADAKGSTELIV
jgi:hypothetical protein